MVKPGLASKAILGVIGDPIAHSLSPHLHGYLIEKLDLAASYQAFRVKDLYLSVAIAGAVALGFRGLNVTAPHKRSVMRYLDAVDERAREIGAVNTLVFENERITGYNTDGYGFLESLRAKRIDPAGRVALLLGAGGSARAVADALQRAGVAALKIWNRTGARAEKLAKAVNGRRARRETIHELPAGSLVINCTSAGMAPDVHVCPLAPEHFRPDLVYVDLVYNPLETTFLKRAMAAGARTRDGLDMLIFQGVRSLDLWLGTEIDARKMLPRIRKHLVSRMQQNAT